MGMYTHISGAGKGPDPVRGRGAGGWGGQKEQGGAAETSPCGSAPRGTRGPSPAQPKKAPSSL